MKFSWHTELPQWITMTSMFALAGWAWSQLPDRVPVHWNLQGQVDGYGNKFVGLLLLPLVVFGLYLLLLLIPRIDPGKQNYASFTNAFAVIRMVSVFFMAVIYVATVLAMFGHQFNMSTIVCLAAGAMLIVVGNFMGKLRPNWFVGVRTPWTLSSRMSWNKTHQLAGWLFMAMGLLLGIVGIVQTTWLFVAMLVIDAACLGWMVVYSYLVYRKDPHRISPAGISPGAE